MIITLSNSLTFVLIVKEAEIRSWISLARGGETGLERVIGVDVDIRCGENAVLMLKSGGVVRLNFLSRPFILSERGSEFIGSRSFAGIVSVLMSDSDVSNSGALSFLTTPPT